MQPPAPTRVAIITGGNQGLGYECARSIAQRKDWSVIIACRNAKAAEGAIKNIKTETSYANVTFMLIDLASLNSVRAFATDYATGVAQGKHQQISALVLNAGVQVLNPATTQDGFEMTFGVNHLGHFLLFNLLLPLMAAQSRVVFVSSATHDPMQKTAMPHPVYTSAAELAKPWKEGEGDGRRAYTTSKLCNILAAYEAGRRLRDSADKSRVHTMAYDPGLMPGTGLARDYNGFLQFGWNYVLPLAIPFTKMNRPSTSGAMLGRLACDDAYKDVTIKYFNVSGELPSSVESYDKEKAKELWDSSISLVGLKPEENRLTKA